MTTLHPDFNPDTDLKLERIVDVSSDLVWRAWTEPELIKRYFTPVPWKTVECVIDLRPGGAFNTVMESPEGERFPGEGCYLDIVPGQRLVWTDALQAGYRPAPAPTSGGPGFSMTAAIIIEAMGRQTRYTAYALHASSEARAQHAAMGFHEGWGTVLDQLVEMCKTL